MNGKSGSDKEEPKIKEILLDYFQTKYSLSNLFEEWSKKDAEFKNMTRFRGLRLIRQVQVFNGNNEKRTRWSVFSLSFVLPITTSKELPK